MSYSCTLLESITWRIRNKLEVKSQKGKKEEFSEVRRKSEDSKNSIFDHEDRRKKQDTSYVPRKGILPTQKGDEL